MRKKTLSLVHVTLSFEADQSIKSKASFGSSGSPRLYADLAGLLKPAQFVNGSPKQLPNYGYLPPLVNPARLFQGVRGALSIRLHIRYVMDRGSSRKERDSISNSTRWATIARGAIIKGLRCY